MSNISQITLPNGDSYTFEGNTYFIEGTQAASTNLWTGVFPEGISDYYHGFTIEYFLPYDGTTSPAELELSNKGSKPIYTNDGSVVTTHYPQYAVIRLTYIVNANLNNGRGCFIATSHYSVSSSMTKETIGSASKVNDISVSEITGWTTNTPTIVTSKQVVVDETHTEATFSDGVLIIAIGTTTKGDSVDVTPGTAAQLTYTNTTVPEIQVTSKTVVTDIT